MNITDVPFFSHDLDAALWGQSRAKRCFYFSMAEGELVQSNEFDLNDRCYLASVLRVAWV